MKLKFTLLILCLYSTTFGQSANTIDALKKENLHLKEQIQKLKQDTTFLRSKLSYYTSLNEPKTYELKDISNSINIQVLSCLGDRNNQTVTIEFIVSHKLLHQSLCIADDAANVKAFDNIGNELPVRTADIGSNSQKDFFGSGKCNKIPTDVPVKGFVILRSVMPGTDLIKFLTVAFKYRNYDSTDEYTYSTLEVKNLKIKW